MNANNATARSLRLWLDSLSIELTNCQTTAQVRAVKVAIRQAEFALTEAAK